MIVGRIRLEPPRPGARPKSDCSIFKILTPDQRPKRHEGPGDCYSPASGLGNGSQQNHEG